MRGARSPPLSGMQVKVREGDRKTKQKGKSKMKIRFTKKMALSVLLCVSAMCVSTVVYAQGAVATKALKTALRLGGKTPGLSSAATKTVTTSARTAASTANSAYWAGGTAAATAYAVSQQRVCTACGGTGWIRCGSCGGSGSRFVFDAWGNIIGAQKCASCNGNGGRPCSH